MEINGIEVTLGADPELFIFNKKTDEPVCPYGMVPGTKEKPEKLGEDGHTIQMDGMALEFNIPPSPDPDRS